jgi:hypothetical protein
VESDVLQKNTGVPGLPSFRGWPLDLAGLLLGVTLFFATLQMVRPYYFLGDDNANYFLPLYDLVAASPHEGTGLAWWNPYQDSGQEVHSRSQPAVLYPPVYLAFAASHGFWGHALAGIDLLAWMHLVLAAWGMYFLTRQMRAGRVWALMWGLLWCSQPFVVQVSRCWISLLFLAAWAPFILWLVLRQTTGGGLVEFGGLGLARVLLVYSGYQHYFLLFSVLEGVFAAVSCCGMDPRSRKHFLLRYAGSWILTGLWSAPLLLPFSVALGESARRGVAMPWEQLLSYSMSWEDWWNAQWGIWRPGVLFLWGSEVFWLGGVWVVVALVGVFWWFRRVQVTQPFLALGICALLAFLGSTLFYVLFAWIPILDRLRWPARNFIFFIFFFLSWSALIFSAWVRGRPRWRMVLLAVILLSLGGNLWINAVRLRGHPWGGEVPDIAWMQAAVDRCLHRTDHRVMTIGMPDFLSSEWRFFCRNYATLVRLPHFMGYDILRTRKQDDFLFGMHHHGSLERFPDEAQLGRLRRWGVRYYFVREDLGPHPAFRELWREGALRLVEDPSAKSVASFRGDPVPVVWRTNGARITLPSAPEGGWLELAVWPSEGMELWVDGRPLGEGWKFDGENPPGVWIAAGAQKVELRVECPGFKTGLVMAGVGLLLVVAYGAWVCKGWSKP